MKRVLELIMSLIATAATYALMHVVLFMDLFKFQHKLPVYVPTVIAVIVGFIFYFLFATPLAGLLLKRLNQTEERLSKMNLKELSLSVIGCIVGLVLANLIGMAFNGFGALGTFIVVLLNILFGILGIRVARRKKDDVNVRTLKEVLMTTPPSTAEDSIYGRPKILDTSVIIDGRILDLLQTGFIEGKIIIPDFVLEELRHIADSADSLKRQRGRRGLDILNEIQKQLAVPVEIQSFHPGQQMEVDSMLLKMADSMDAFVVTNDFNLNKVAEFPTSPSPSSIRLPSWLASPLSSRSSCTRSSTRSCPLWTTSWQRTAPSTTLWTSSRLPSARTIRSSWTSRMIWPSRTLWSIRSSRAWRLRFLRLCTMSAWTSWSTTLHSVWSSRACASRTT